MKSPRIAKELFNIVYRWGQAGIVCDFTSPGEIEEVIYVRKM